MAEPDLSANRKRYEALHQILLDRKREISTEVLTRIREMQGVEAGRRGRSVAQARTLEDMDLALVEMKSQTLVQIEEALKRLEAGTYGQCTTCRQEISESRLRALPFTPRCKDCEYRLEVRLEQMRRAQKHLQHYLAGL